MRTGPFLEAGSSRSPDRRPGSPPRREDHSCGTAPESHRFRCRVADAGNLRPRFGRRQRDGPAVRCAPMTLAASEPPASGQADFRCSPWTQAQGVDPIGSAGSFDELLLVEWAAAVAVGRERGRGARRRGRAPGRPRDDGRPARRRRRATGCAGSVHHRRTSTHHLEGVDHRVEVDAIPDAAGRAARGTRSAPARLAERRRRRAARGARVRPRPARPVLRPLGHAAARRAGGTRPRTRGVWRCSHTGGHRYAPTAITLPDGRAWAYADVGLLDGVLARDRRRHGARRPRPRLHRARPVGAGRRAGAVRRARLGAGSTARSTDVAHARSPTTGGRPTVELRWRLADGTTGRADGEVEVTRILPVLVCGEPPEAAEEDQPGAGAPPPRAAVG